MNPIKFFEINEHNSTNYLITICNSLTEDGTMLYLDISTRNMLLILKIFPYMIDSNELVKISNLWTFLELMSIMGD
jgi:hypothetical protein